MTRPRPIERQPRRKEGALTPANAVTVTGLVLTVWGSFRLNTGVGFSAVLAGRLLDMLDGFVARKTGSSVFGAKLDAVSDKLAALAIVSGSWHFQLTPRWFLLFLLVQHVFVAMLATIASARGNPLRVTQMGKNNMFLHMLALIVFVGTALSGGFWSDALSLLADILAAFSVAYGIFTAGDYYVKFREQV